MIVCKRSSNIYVNDSERWKVIMITAWDDKVVHCDVKVHAMSYNSKEKIYFKKQALKSNFYR
jgi:hypothetical protein